MRLQLIPVRGRKPTTLLVDDDMLAAITTYPRKGTETPDLPEDQQHEDQLQLIPVRGRKLVDVLTNESGNQLQLIPARGRKPVRFHLAHDERLITTYPRKGTKKPLRAGTNQCGGALLFRVSSVLGSAGGRSGGDGRVNGNFLDVLRDVPLQGADLIQIGGDLLQGLFNVLGIQRPNALAL